MKELLFSNWHLMRWVALITGSALIITWIINSAPMAGLFGAFILFQAITNTGCIMGRCAGPNASCAAGSDSGNGNDEYGSNVDYKKVPNTRK